jgi:chorismate mutase
VTLRPASAVDIDIVRDRSVTITFDDDVVAVYPVKALRRMPVRELPWLA